MDKKDSFLHSSREHSEWLNEGAQIFGKFLKSRGKCDDLYIFVYLTLVNC